MSDDIKDFDAVRAAKREKAGEPPTFRLMGRQWNCLPIQPAHTLRDLVGEDNSIQGTFVYLQGLLVEDQREDFAKIVIGSDEIDMDIISEVVKYVTEKYNGRPTVSASSSASA